MKTRSMRKSASAFILSALLCTVSYSQKAPIKYGTVDKADLEMTVYPLDTTAAAAILCDYGFFSSSSYDFIRVLRIKIFKKEGTIWGDKVFPLGDKADIRGITYNLENGEIVETKLKSESVFLERVSEDFYRTRVAMPNVREGSVIDIEFRYPWLPSVWRFQEVIPVRWSELIIQKSEYVDFRKNFFGFVPLSESSSERWVAKDVPAFKEEPFMSNSTNFLTRFEIEVLSISIPPSSSRAGFYREYSTTWDAVNTRLDQAGYFGMAMRGCMFLNSKVKEIDETYSTPMEKLVAAHEYVKHSVRWNDLEALFISAEELITPFNKKIGNSADVNLILIQMLKKLDLTVYPVALSTRTNGFLSPVYPSLSKLNYVVAYVKIDDKFYLVDATEEFLPVGLLPERCLNLQGRLIDEIQSDWVDLVPVRKDKKLVQAELTVGPDLVMTGKITRNSIDYAALEFRKDFETYNSEEDYLKDLESTYQGLTILNSEISGLDSIYKPVREVYEVRLKNRITSAGDLLYIYPLMFEQITENPFKSEARNYPVDFIYPREKTFIAKITLPEGYQVVELPKVMVLKLPDNSVTSHYQITATGNDVYLTYKFNLAKAHFSIEEYADLRAFYSELIKKHSEPVILKAIPQ